MGLLVGYIHVNIGKLMLGAMYLGRVRVAGHSFAAAPTHVSKVATPPAAAAWPQRAFRDFFHEKCHFFGQREMQRKIVML
jgi:hypothetical protein